MERPLLIVNPTAGSRRAGRHAPTVTAALRAALGEVDVALTEHGGHGIELARAAVVDGRPLVVAVGGDGTLHEVVNGLLEAAGAGAGTAPAPAASLPRLGVVAVGTGADFGRTLETGRDLEAQIAALASGRERPLDVVRARFVGRDGATAERFFVNVLSAGPGGLVDVYVRRLPGVLGGRLGYLLASLAALVRCHRARLRLTTWAAPAAPPTSRELGAFLVAACNGRVFGGGMRIAPQADPGDGLLDLVVVSVERKRTLVRKLPTVYRGRHLAIAGVEHERCARLELEVLDERDRASFLLDVDGEPLGAPPLALEVVPHALVVRA